jgi:transposase
MGDLTRFTNRRQISAYLGLAPRSYESGEANDRKGHITRQGSSRLRAALCQAVWSRIRERGPDHAGYQRLVERNPKHKKIAVVAIMRRLGVRMWHKAHDAQANTALTECGRPHPCRCATGKKTAANHQAAKNQTQAELCR